MGDFDGQRTGTLGDVLTVYDCKSECTGRVVVTVKKIIDEAHLLQYVENP